MKRSALFLRIALFACVLALFLASSLHARYNPGWNWRTVRTDNFIIYYPEGHEAFARRVIALAPEVHRDVSGYLGVKPSPVPLVLNPGTDLFNGFFSLLPSMMSLYETPCGTLRGFGSSTSDLMDLVFTHEYTHCAHITTRSGLYKEITRVLGDDAGVLNALAPGWMIEGVTTNTETLFTDGGRGRSPEFAGMIRSFTEDGRLWSLSASGAENPYSPPGGRFYLSGYYIVDYLNRTYGPDAFARVSKRQGGNPFRMSGGALKYVVKKSPGKFYGEFMSDFTARADSVRNAAIATGLPAGKVIASGTGDYFCSHFWTKDGAIRAVRTGYDKVTAVVDIDPRTGRITHEKPAGNMIMLGKVRPLGDGRLIYGSPFYHPFGEGELDTADLVALDPSSGERTRLTRGAHVYNAAASPDGKRIAATARNGMWMDLLVMNADGSDVRKLVSRPGLLWDTPAWSPDGSTVAAVVKDGARNAIVLADATTGALKTPLVPDSHGYSDPEFTSDGRSIVFTSDRSGVWNVYALELDTLRLRRLTAVFWDVEEPHVSPDGATLSFLSLSRGLWRICTVPFSASSGSEESCAAGGPFEPSPRALEVAGPIPESRGIPLARTLKPFLHVPWAVSDEKGDAFGLFLMGGDPVGINRYSAQAFWGVKSERMGYDVALTNRSFWPRIGLRAYDSAREGNTLGGGKSIWFREIGTEASLTLPIVHRIEPGAIQSSWRAGVRTRMFRGLEDVKVDPGRDQSVAVFGEAMIVDMPNTPPRDSVPRWGRSLYASVEGSLESLGSELPGHAVLAAATQCAPSPLRHHGFALTVAAMNQSGRLHYDTTPAIPLGYDSDEPEGGFNLRNVASVSLEYKFPIWDADRGYGMTSLHLHRLKGSLFVNHGAGWDGSFDRDVWARNARTSVGATLRMELATFGIVPLDLGVAAGYRTAERDGFVRFVMGDLLGGSGLERNAGSLWKDRTGIKAPRWGL